MHLQLSFSPTTSEQSEMLIALLDAYGFTGFEEQENVLLAFIPAEAAAQLDWEELATTLPVSFVRTTMEETNWNAVWESNFQPVYVGDFLYIRADFHPPASGVQHELIITPKMSFGTGHHATTWLMANAMRSIGFQNKRVFDFGTGTGILAVLASRLGAEHVWAIDNDSWSIDNSRENIERNAVNNIDLQLADTFDPEGEKFDIILANINKHVILEHFQTLAARLKADGVLLLSGLLNTDEADIRLAASIQKLSVKQVSEKDNWLCISLCH